VWNEKTSRKYNSIIAPYQAVVEPLEHIYDI